MSQNLHTQIEHKTQQLNNS